MKKYGLKVRYQKVFERNYNKAREIQCSADNLMNRKITEK